MLRRTYLALTAATILGGATTAFAESGKDIVDTATEAGDFSTLLAAAEAAGLVETLKGDGPFTVFAPTDEAFAALPEGTVDTLLMPENKDQLTSILTYHVVPGKVMSGDLSDGMTAETVQGSEVTIGTEGGVMVNDATVVTARYRGVERRHPRDRRRDHARVMFLGRAGYDPARFLLGVALFRPHSGANFSPCLRPTVETAATHRPCTVSGSDTAWTTLSSCRPICGDDAHGMKGGSVEEHPAVVERVDVKTWCKRIIDVVRRRRHEDFGMRHVRQSCPGGFRQTVAPRAITLPQAFKPIRCKTIRQVFGPHIEQCCKTVVDGTPGHGCLSRPLVRPRHLGAVSAQNKLCRRGHFHGTHRGLVDTVERKTCPQSHDISQGRHLIVGKAPFKFGIVTVNDFKLYADFLRQCDRDLPIELSDPPYVMHEEPFDAIENRRCRGKQQPRIRSTRYGQRRRVPARQCSHHLPKSPGYPFGQAVPVLTYGFKIILRAKPVPFQLEIGKIQIVIGIDAPAVDVARLPRANCAFRACTSLAETVVSGSMSRFTAR